MSSLTDEQEHGGSSFNYYAGVSIKAGYRRSTAACKASYRRLFGFH